MPLPNESKAKPFSSLRAFFENKQDEVLPSPESQHKARVRTSFVPVGTVVHDHTAAPWSTRRDSMMSRKSDDSFTGYTKTSQILNRQLVPEEAAVEIDSPSAPNSVSKSGMSQLILTPLIKHTPPIFGDVSRTAQSSKKLDHPVIPNPAPLQRQADMNENKGQAALKKKELVVTRNVKGKTSKESQTTTTPQTRRRESAIVTPASKPKAKTPMGSGVKRASRTVVTSPSVAPSASSASKSNQSTPALARRKKETEDVGMPAAASRTPRTPGSYARPTSSSSARLMSTPPSKNYSPLVGRKGRAEIAKAVVTKHSAYSTRQDRTVPEKPQTPGGSLKALPAIEPFDGEGDFAAALDTDISLGHLSLGSEDILEMEHQAECLLTTSSTPDSLTEGT